MAAGVQPTGAHLSIYTRCLLHQFIFCAEPINKAGRSGEAGRAAPWLGPGWAGPPPGPHRAGGALACPGWTAPGARVVVAPTHPSTRADAGPDRYGAPPTLGLEIDTVSIIFLPPFPLGFSLIGATFFTSCVPFIIVSACRIYFLCGEGAVRVRWAGW